VLLSALVQVSPLLRKSPSLSCRASGNRRGSRKRGGRGQKLAREGFLRLGNLNRASLALHVLTPIGTMFDATAAAALGHSLLHSRSVFEEVYVVGAPQNRRAKVEVNVQLIGVEAVLGSLELGGFLLLVKCLVLAFLARGALRVLLFARRGGRTGPGGGSLGLLGGSLCCCGCFLGSDNLKVDYRSASATLSHQGLADRFESYPDCPGGCRAPE
jgi:hypothetical protein